MASQGLSTNAATRRDGQMRSMDLDLVGAIPGQIKTNDFKIDTCHLLAMHSALLG